MIVYVNDKQIIETLKCFHTITGLKTTLFDDEHNILAEYPKEHCRLCTYINMNAAGKSLCEKSNWEAFEKCYKTKQVYFYMCHIRLVEVVVPLIKNDKIIGYVMFGQIINNKNTDLCKKKLKVLSSVIDYDTAIKLLSSISYHSNEKIKAEAKILETCAMNFILEETINTKEYILSDKIMKYIEKNALKAFTIEKMCEQLNISRTLAYNIFYKQKHMGIMEYVKNLKIQKAIELLKDRTYSIKEIAFMTGFTDSNHFIKVFKKNTGNTPKQYQKSI